MTDGRIKRPPLDRREPIRSWSGLFGNRSQPNPSWPWASEATDGRAPGAVGKGVDLGYRVIDEYIKQGEAAARAFQGGVRPENAAGDMQALTERMVGYATDFASLWFEMFGLLAANGALRSQANGEGGPPGNPFSGSPWGAPPAGPGGDIPPFRATAPESETPEPAPSAPTNGASPAPVSTHTRVAVRVRSSRPTAVTLDLQPGAGASDLIVHDLRAVEPKKPRIQSVEVERGDDDRVTIGVNVDDDHPPGLYSGMVLDAETNLPRGTLSVQIDP